MRNISNLINSIDQCYFSSDCSKLLIIPIPLLSTPVFLLVLDAESNVKFIREIYNLSKITVRHFILTNLIDGLKNQLINELNEIKNSSDLITRFKDELSKILLPIKWEIDRVLDVSDWPKGVERIFDGSIKCEECSNCCGKNVGEDCGNVRYLFNEYNEKEIVRICEIETGEYVKNWPDVWAKNDDKKTMDLYYFHFFVSLNNEDEGNKKFIICLAQTSFKFPDENGKYDWIQVLPDYDIAASQLGSMLSSVFNLIYNQWKEIQKVKIHAVSAAISQVMARNMSHNIGSHVLSKMIVEDQIMTVKKKVKTDDQNNVTTEYQCKTITSDLQSKSNEKFIADFFDYLKCRMDYLADVTTNTPVIENVNSIYGNIISPFIQNRILNDRISGITNFNYEIILCNVGNKNACCGTDTKDCFSKIPNKIKDTQVSIPNDVVGRHAFYTILENIIRNTSKHAKKPETGNVEFKIKIEEASVYKAYSEKIDWDAYLAISIFDNCKVESEQHKALVESQNKKLNETILDKNKLRHGHWGLIEMDASAAYLRKISVDKIDSDDFDIVDYTGQDPITKSGELAVFQAYSEQDKYLGYRFFLRKPQEILIITKDENDKNEVLSKSCKDQNALINEGVWIKTIQKIEKDILDNTVSPFRLIVITPEATSVEDKIKNNPLFSKRFKTLTSDYLDYACKDKLWEVYLNDKPKYKRNGNCKREKGNHDNHGKNYCVCLNDNVFVEIQFSATEVFFKDTLYTYSWPTRIAIIDERVQAFSEKERYIIEANSSCNQTPCYHNKGVPYHVLYKNTNIMVPTQTECDLNEQDFGNVTADKKLIMERITDYIRNCTKVICKNDNNGNGLTNTACEFIVIHIGIIEKMIKTWNEKNDKQYDKDNADQVRNFIKEVILISIEDFDRVYDTLVITSGRGKPQNLPEDIRYINFSTLYQYLTVQRNKHALTEALYSARKQSNT